MPDAETQRKLIEILRILSESTEEMGARKIAEEMNRRGYNLGGAGGPLSSADAGRAGLHEETRLPRPGPYGAGR
jgi:hypothetical protein